MLNIPTKKNIFLYAATVSVFSLYALDEDSVPSLQSMVSSFIVKQYSSAPALTLPSDADCKKIDIVPELKSKFLLPVNQFCVKKAIRKKWETDDCYLPPATTTPLEDNTHKMSYTEDLNIALMQTESRLFEQVDYSQHEALLYAYDATSNQYIHHKSFQHDHVINSTISNNGNQIILCKKNPDDENLYEIQFFTLDNDGYKNTGHTRKTLQEKQAFNRFIFNNDGSQCTCIIDNKNHAQYPEVITSHDVTIWSRSHDTIDNIAQFKDVFHFDINTKGTIALTVQDQIVSLFKLTKQSESNKQSFVERWKREYPHLLQAALNPDGNLIAIVTKTEPANEKSKNIALQFKNVINGRDAFIDGNEENAYKTYALDIASQQYSTRCKLELKKQFLLQFLSPEHAVILCAYPVTSTQGFFAFDGKHDREYLCSEYLDEQILQQHALKINNTNNLILYKKASTSPYTHASWCIKSPDTLHLLQLTSSTFKTDAERNRTFFHSLKFGAHATIIGHMYHPKLKNNIVRFTIAGNWTEALQKLETVNLKQALVLYQLVCNPQLVTTMKDEHFKLIRTLPNTVEKMMCECLSIAHKNENNQ